jgi:hypothetical protein
VGGGRLVVRGGGGAVEGGGGGGGSGGNEGWESGLEGSGWAKRREGGRGMNVREEKGERRRRGKEEGESKLTWELQ